MQVIGPATGYARDLEYCRRFVPDVRLPRRGLAR
jgi:hypothetical protein